MKVASRQSDPSKSPADPDRCSSSANEEETILRIRTRMQATHDSGLNQSLSWRLSALKTLLRMVLENQSAIALALGEDLGKHETEAYMTEIALVEHEIQLFLRHLSTWLKPQPVSSPMACLPAYSSIVYKPLAAPGVLIIGPFNYPFLLSLQPAIGALAAGNPTLIKPSEQCPATSRLLDTLIRQYFSPSRHDVTTALQCLQGGAATSERLLQYPWGKVCFTGSSRVGALVAQATAKTLTPTVLELGGKCPVIVDETVSTNHLEQVAHRIVWAKTLNAGQTCAAVDYVLVHESHVQHLCRLLVQALETQFDKQYSELGRIVTVQHARRLYGLIQQAEDAIQSPPENTRGNGSVLTGGSADCCVEDRFIAPTFMLNPSWDSPIMQDEIFGPILPIISFATQTEAIRLIRSIPLTPLCLYVFTDSQRVFEEYCARIPSGSAMRNDCLIHLMSSSLPFGGLGSSGYGKYHGKYSLETFSHALATMYRPLGYGFDWGRLRCHPFSVTGKGVGSSVSTKSWILRNVILKLPYLPVMNMKRVLVVVLALVLCRWLPWRSEMLGLGHRSAAVRLAGLLEDAAAMLRTSVDGMSSEL